MRRILGEKTAQRLRQLLAGADGPWEADENKVRIRGKEIGQFHKTENAELAALCRNKLIVALNQIVRLESYIREQAASKRELLKIAGLSGRQSPYKNKAARPNSEVKDPHDFSKDS